MNLKDYLQKLNVDQRRAYAARAGVSMEYIYQLRAGNRVPSQKEAQKYVDASLGELTLANVRPDIWGRKPVSESAA
jgi:hypothetical protein